VSSRASRYVYGPVPSRRLGRSLGVDLVPFKTCSYGCTYCQLGRTKDKTTERREYVPVDGVLDELAEKLRLGPPPDFVGLAGSGEPTLHARIGDLIAGIKNLTSIPVAVLTNGSLLWTPEVRAGLAEADLVMPSLDAGTDRTFQRVNRPHRDISFERMVDGLVAFVAVPVETLERFRLLFSGSAEVIAECRRTTSTRVLTRGSAEDDISALLSRRPCTVEDIATGLGLPPNEVIKNVHVLCGRGTVRTERRGNAVYYRTFDANGRVASDRIQ